MLYEFNLETPREYLYDITPFVREALRKSGKEEGVALVYCPHTTAGITINENADPDVISDLLLGLDKSFPDRREFKHRERNSSSHLKATTVGSSVAVIIQGGKLLLGTWQSIFFCEFDPPRRRKFYVKIT